MRETDVTHLSVLTELIRSDLVITDSISSKRFLKSGDYQVS